MERVKNLIFLGIIFFGFTIFISPVKAAECGGAVTCACEDVVTSDYTLTADLDCSSGVGGLIIGANDITIDGNNHKIIGNNAGYGISNDGNDNITIKNFTDIVDFNRGIYLINTTSSTLQNNTTRINSVDTPNLQTRYGIYISNSSSLTLTNNTAKSNFHGIYLSGCNSSILSNNTVKYNSINGIYINNSNSIELTNNTANSNGTGIYLKLSSSVILTENTISNNITGLSRDFSTQATYFNNTLLQNKDYGILLMSPTTQKANINDIITVVIGMNDINGLDCPNCEYSITINPFETAITSKESDQLTTSFAVTKYGLYSFFVTTTDTNNNIIKKNFTFLVGADNSITQRYYLRGTQNTHGQPLGNGNDTGTMLLTPPTETEEWFCSIWVENHLDEMPNYPLGSISDIDVYTWYKNEGSNTPYGPGSLGIERFFTYHFTGSDYTVPVIEPASEYISIEANFTNLNWSIDYLTDWYLLAMKIKSNSISQQTNTTQPSYVDFTYQYTTTPAIKSISNENIVVLSATAPAEATSSASIVLDNPNTSATSTTLVLTDFKRPFLNATSSIDSTSTTTITTTISASSSSTLDAVALDIVPSTGSIEISIDTWNTTGDYYKKWSEEGSSHDISTQHTVGDMKPNAKYILKIDSVSLATYTSDSSGNITFTYSDGYSDKIFELTEDAQPVITILGNNPATVNQHYTYTDSGATATDNIDGDISSSIVVTNNVNTAIAGSYIVTYRSTDTAGNISTSNRTVNVVNVPGVIITPSSGSGTNNNTNNNNNNQPPVIINWTTGQWIKTSDVSTVYLVDTNYVRHAYPNEAIWYSYFDKDFSFVTVTSSENLYSYPLGKNVPFKSGTLIKIPSVPKVYLVSDNGILHWIKSEAAAIRLYGLNWNKLVKDLSEAFFGDYSEGSEIE